MIQKWNHATFIVSKKMHGYFIGQGMIHNKATRLRETNRNLEEKRQTGKPNKPSERKDDYEDPV